MAPRFPFPRYPDGWFQVAYADELAPGDVVPLRYFGRDLVLYRTQDGAPHVLDAHCPHMGAHLGYGGSADQYQPLTRLARDLGLPSTQLWMAYNAPYGGRPEPATRFPTPKWTPVGGWKVDPALVY